MWTLIRWFLIVVGVLAFACFWLVFGLRCQCPVCGCELEDDLAYPGQKLRRCRRCGWERGDSNA